MIPRLDKIHVLALDKSVCLGLRVLDGEAVWGFKSDDGLDP